MNPVTVARSAAEAMLLVIDPSGGQRTARRNALAAVQRDDVAARQRAEAAAAFTVTNPPRVQSATH
jgi:hypothetical protein